MAAPLSRLRRVRAQEDEAILINGFATPFGVRFARPDLPRLIRSRRLENLVGRLSGDFHDRPFDDDTRSGILPQSDEKFARERDDRRFAPAAASSPDPIVKPSAER
jgi:hypothetical protein